MNEYQKRDKENIEQDGYISKKITVHYSIDNTLEKFNKMTK